MSTIPSSTVPNFAPQATAATTGIRAAGSSATGVVGGIVDGVNNISNAQTGADRGEEIFHLIGRTVLNFMGGWGEVANFFRPYIEKLGLHKFSLGRKLFRWAGDKIWGKPKTNVEQERWQKLAQDGLMPWNMDQMDPSKKHHTYRKEAGKFVPVRPDLDANFIGFDTEGTWVNNKFSWTRDEADLRAQDIWGFATFAEKFGSSWMTTSEQNREAIANKALELGLVREHKGTIDIDWTPELETFSDSLLNP